MRRQFLFLSVPLIAPALLLSACSSGSEQPASESAQYDVATESADSAAGSSVTRAPNVSPSAAPGVAFNYNYAFRLPDAKISAVQEQHAAACETLGLSRCRITGMRYTLVDEDRVEAMLAFKLDPAIARKFGKDAIASVEKAEGILVDSVIQGVDVGSGISASQSRSSGLTAELGRIEKRLSAGGLGDRERTELQEQAARIRGQLDSERDTRRAGEESLATTPMEFTYRGGEGIPGFNNGNPFAQVVSTSVSSFVTMLNVVLLLIGVALPWIILITLLVLLFRSAPGQAFRRWWSQTPKLSEPEKTDG